MLKIFKLFIFLKMYTLFYIYIKFKISENINYRYFTVKGNKISENLNKYIIQEDTITELKDFVLLEK